MRLIVLGRSPARPNPGEASAGYLVEAGATRLLLDVGPGVVAQLLRVGTPESLDAVIVSHLHSDHMLDLVTLRHSFPWGTPPRRRLPVIVPPGATDQLIDLARGVGDAAFFEGTFEITEHDGERELTVGDLCLRPLETQHYVPCWGFRIAGDGRLLAYSADSGPCEALPAIAEDSDLFVCEATLRSLEEDSSHPLARGHLLAREAGEAARRGRARRLLLTHLPLEDDGGGAAGAAEEAFGAPVQVAAPLAHYDV